MNSDKRIECLTFYLRSLSVTEPFAGDSPTRSPLKEWRPKQSFTESMSSSRQNFERCSDDFSQFSFARQSLDNLLPPVKVSFSETCGRFLQASRDIDAGETIFWESPVVMAPKSGSDPICLDCFRPLPTKSWPVCVGCKGPKCQESCDGYEHSSAECNLIRQCFESKDLETDLQLVKRLNVILTPLRTHIAILENPPVREIVKALQSNAEQRKKAAIGEFLEKFVVAFLHENLNFDNEISSDFIHHVCGVFDTNAFDVTFANKGQARALLPLASLMNHSCTSNTQHWFFGGWCVVRASVSIHKGDSITNTYTQTLSGTKMRQNHLALTKLFTCSCERCLDPSELGTHLSSIQCRKCKDHKGFLIPPKSISNPWICDSCGDKFPSSSALNMIKVAANFVSSAKFMDTDDLKKIWSKLTMMLGKQHYTTVQLLLLYVKRVIENIETGKS